MKRLPLRDFCVKYEFLMGGKIGLIAGKGMYPRLLVQCAKSQGVREIALVAFEGETERDMTELATSHTWLKVGQLKKLADFFLSHGIDQAIMAGQITPGRLYDFRPDFAALWILARLKKRNAETLFGAIAEYLHGKGIHLLPATTFMEKHLAKKGHIAGPRLCRRAINDMEFGWPIAKQISALDIGQTIIVKDGTVLAVEGFDGTNPTIRRGGELGKKNSTMIKVSKPNQDMRFDVPVIGIDTLRAASESSVTTIILEAEKTLLLGLEEIAHLADKMKLTLHGNNSSQQ